MFELRNMTVLKPKEFCPKIKILKSDDKKQDIEYTISRKAGDILLV